MNIKRVLRNWPRTVNSILAMISVAMLLFIKYIGYLFHKTVRNWPRVVSFILALIPVGMLVFIVFTVIYKSIPAIHDVGWGELFSTNFISPRGSGSAAYGLVPAIWGSFLAVALAMLIAIPISIAMAVLSSEFSLGFISRGLRATLGLLLGIPPIIYYVMAGILIVANVFMLPNFSTNQCTLYGGIMLAFFIVPFMAPMVEDAIKNVPHNLKEASLALGANRWQTLTGVTLPVAMSGIFYAVMLGVLKAMGDVFVLAGAIGWAKPDNQPDMPDPLWDVLEINPPLTTTGPLLGGTAQAGRSTCDGISCDVAYLSGLLVLIIAFVLLSTAVYLQNRWKRRIAQ